MAKGNVREYLRGENVWRKKYFYVLRPLLAMRWIEQELGAVPIEFARLLDATVSTPELRRAIDELLEEKKSGAELDHGPQIPAISEFIDQEIVRLERIAGEQPSAMADSDALNMLFREMLDEVWGRST